MSYNAKDAKDGTARTLSRRLHVGECTSTLCTFENDKNKNEAEFNRLKATCNEEKDWPTAPVQFSQSSNIWVFPDQLVCGGTKARVLADVLKQPQYAKFDEYVYVTDFPGGGQIALARAAQKLGKRATLVLASSNSADKPNPRVAKALGATILEVHTFVEAMEYVRQSPKTRMLVPNGFELDGMSQALSRVAQSVAKTSESFDQVWCAVGSGYLIQALMSTRDPPLGRTYHGVAVTGGIPDQVAILAKQFPEELQVILHPQPWTEVVKADAAPLFHSSIYYDAKVWTYVQQAARLHPKHRILFWNVL